MGMFNVADFVTGDTITEDEEVVAFLVRQTDGYPFDRNPHGPALRPADRWKLESLPIHGKYDSYGRVTPNDPKHASVRLALSMTNCTDWADLCRRGLDVEGVEVQIMVPLPGESSTAVHHYGLAVMLKSTADALLALKAGESMADAVAGALEIYDLRARTHGRLRSLEISHLPDPARVKALVDAAFSLDSVCNLSGDRTYRDEERRIYEAPRLFQAFDHNLFGWDIRNALMSSPITQPQLNTRECDIRPAKENLQLTQVLEGGWLAYALYLALIEICREFSPSIRSGQWRNDKALLEFNRITAAARFDRLVQHRADRGMVADERVELSGIPGRYMALAHGMERSLDIAAPDGGQTRH